MVAVQLCSVLVKEHCNAVGARGAAWLEKQIVGNEKIVMPRRKMEVELLNIRLIMEAVKTIRDGTLKLLLWTERLSDRLRDHLRCC